MNTLQRLAAAACLAAAFASPLPCRAAAAASGAESGWKFDTSVSPCDDFYQYVCGIWMKENPIPADQSSWGRLGEVSQRTRETLRQLIEAASADDPHRSRAERQIGDFYASCMDERTIEEKGITPLAPALQRIAALKSKRELTPLLAYLHALGASAFFELAAEPDFQDSTVVIAAVNPGGMGLQNRDIYLKDDPQPREQKKAYAALVQRLLELVGETPADAGADAARVLEIETALARVRLDAVARRDPTKLHHKMSLQQLAALSPGLDWRAYLEARQAPLTAQVNVAEPDYVEGVGRLIAATDLRDLRAYLRWHLVRASTLMLPAAFGAASFGFYGRTLAGQQERQPRWRSCVRATEATFGEALGQGYVERAFPPAARARVEKMVESIKRAFETDLATLPWMTEGTKKKALAKFRLVDDKIGYPDAWRDYGKLEIVRGDALGNLQRAQAFELAHQIATIGKPVDRGAWRITPQTVNATYEPATNDITLAAAYLQPPSFDPARDEAYNLGALGLVIGHELTHGFDDEGRRFDGHGNLEDWWTPAEVEEFERRSSCFADQYSGYVTPGGLKLDGRLTLNENVADNGGARIAFIALEESLKGKEPKLVDGLTPEQRFFVARAQQSCENLSPQNESQMIRTDPHPPRRYRVNGVDSNMPEFQRAFGCKEDAPMVRKSPCRVW